MPSFYRHLDVCAYRMKAVDVVPTSPLKLSCFAPGPHRRFGTAPPVAVWIARKHSNKSYGFNHNCPIGCGNVWLGPIKHLQPPLVKCASYIAILAAITGHRWPNRCYLCNNPPDQSRQTNIFLPNALFLPLAVEHGQKKGGGGRGKGGKRLQRFFAGQFLTYVCEELQ